MTLFVLAVLLSWHSNASVLPVTFTTEQACETARQDVMRQLFPNDSASMPLDRVSKCIRVIVEPPK